MRILRYFLKGAAFFSVLGGILFGMFGIWLMDNYAPLWLNHLFAGLIIFILIIVVGAIMEDG